MEIDVQFDPPRATAQEKKYTDRNGKVVVYESVQAKTAKQILRLVLAPHKPRGAMTSAVALDVLWRFPYKGSAHYEGEYKQTRPDTDNLDKALKDVMTELGFWTDDALVAREHIAKIWHRAKPGLFIRISPITDTKLTKIQEQEWQ